MLFETLFSQVGLPPRVRVRQPHIPLSHRSPKHKLSKLSPDDNPADRRNGRFRSRFDTGAGQPPCHGVEANAAWLEIVLAAADLVAWAQLIGFTEAPELARCEINALRYRVLHVAARITRGARQLRLRIDATWRWAGGIATAWQRLRAAFP